MGLAALALAVTASLAPAVELEWHAPEDCPDAAWVTSRLAAYLDRAPALDEPTRVDAEVRRFDDGAWELTLRFEARPEEPRVLTSHSCEGLAEAAVVVVAIAVAPDAIAVAPDAVADEPSVPSPDEPASAPPPATPPPATPRNAATITRSGDAARGATRPVELSVTALAGVGVGAVPVGLAFAPSLAASARRWRVGLAALYEPTRSLRLPDLPASGSDVMHWALGPEACWLPHPRPRLALPVCGGIELGQLVAAPVQLVDGQRRRSLWAAVTLATGLRARVHRRVALWLAPAAVITLTPARVVVQGEPSPLFRTTPVGFRGLAGLEVILW